MVLRVMPLRSSPGPIGYIYDATQMLMGVFLQGHRHFSSHQGHQAFTNLCPNSEIYCRAMGVSTMIFSVNNPNHILSSGLELMDGLFPQWIPYSQTLRELLS
jgi:hypothetical protein